MGISPGSGMHQALAHVPHHLVKEEHHRGPVGLGDIEGLHGHGENVLVIGGGQGHDGMIAMGPPARLIHITLMDVGGDSRGGAAPLHVDDDTGNLRHDGIAERLLLQGKAGPLVAVMTLHPVSEAPMMAHMEAISSSI